MMFWPKSGGCCCSGECGTIVVTVRLCSDNSLVSGAVVTVEDSTGATVGTGTTDATGVVTVTIEAAGTYTVLATKAGNPPTIKSVAATCTTNAVTISMGRGLVFLVRECFCASQDALVSVTQTSGGTFTGSALTILNSWNVNYGIVTFDIPIANGNVFSYTVTHSPTGTTTGTATVSGLTSGVCAYTVTTGIGQDPDFFCFPPDICMDPVPSTLLATFSANPTRFGTLAGTTVSLARQGTNFTWTLCMAATQAGGPQNFRLTINLLESGCATVSPPQPPGLNGINDFRRYLAADTTCSGTAQLWSSLNLTSGTASCPIAFTLTESINLGGGSPGTIVISE